MYAKRNSSLFKYVEAVVGRWLALGGQHKKGEGCLPGSSVRPSELQTLEED